jgi:hypothetical protein
LEFPLDFKRCLHWPILMQLLPVPDPQLTMVVEIIFTSSNKRTEHANVQLLHLSTCKSQPDGGL